MTVILNFFTKIRIAFAMVTIIVLAFILIYAPQPRLTYDSHDYLRASESMATYLHGQNAEGYTYLFRPPALPLYLHFFADKVSAARWLNAVCFLASLWLCYLIGRAANLQPIFSILFPVLVGGSYPWLQNHLFVWSEPLFNVFLLLLVWMLITQQKTSWIALACLLLYFIRKAGIFVSAAVVISFLAQREYRKALLIGLLAASFFLLWESFTYATAGYSPSQSTFNDLTSQSRWLYADVLSGWFLPRNIPTVVRLVLLTAVAGIAFWFWKGKTLVAPFGEKEMRSVWIIVMVYLSVFALVLGASEFDEAERYLSVMLPLVMLLVCVAADSIYRYLEQNKKGAYVMVPFILWMLYPLGRTFYHFM